jgi:hypothetical protein
MEHSLQTAHRHIWIKIPTALSSSVAVFDGHRLEYPRQERCVKYFNRNRHSSGCTAGEICPQLQAETHWKALLNKQEDSSHKKRAEVTVVHLPIDFGIKVHYSLSNANPHTHNHKAIINPCPSSIQKESSPLCKKKKYAANTESPPCPNFNNFRTDLRSNSLTSAELQNLQIDGIALSSNRLIVEVVDWEH